MHEYTPEAAQAIESRSRQFTHKLMVDWNNNGQYDHPLSDMSEYVVRSSRGQAISSTAPEELMLIEGHGSASLEMELTGSFRNIPLTGHFAPYNGRSVFYAKGLSLGVSMYYDIAVWTDTGWEWYRQFTGVVREVEALRAEGIVKLDCLDNVERLRTGLSLHAYGVPKALLQDGYKRGALVDSSSIIDMAARTGGFTMGPKPGMGNEDSYRQRFLSVPFHGSILPEIGQLDEAQTFHLTESWENQPAREDWAEAYTGGPHGYLALNAVPSDRTQFGTKKYWLSEEAWGASQGNTKWVIGCWVRFDGAGVHPTADSLITLRLQNNEYGLLVRDDGAVTPRLRIEGSLQTTSNWMFMSGTGWHYVEVAFWSYGNYIDCRTRVDNEQSSVVRIYNASPPGDNDALSGLVTVQHNFPVSDVEIVASKWGEDVWHTTKESIEPLNTADVSQGRNRVMYTLRETEKPAWDIAKEVSAAEYGVVWFDEFGRFRFWNFEDVTAQHETVNRKFDLSDVEGLSMRTTMDSVRNMWVVESRTGYSDNGIFYDLDKDGEPWATKDNAAFLNPNSELWKAKFNPIPATLDNGTVVGKWSFYYLKAKPNLMCPHPWSIPTIAENAPATGWDERYPKHAKKTYRGNTYIGGEFRTEQKWVRRDLVRMSILNFETQESGFWLNNKDQGRFRMQSTLVYEDTPETWSVSTTDVGNMSDGDPTQDYAKSIPRYGERVIELKDNFWLQDKFQTREMLKKIIKKFGRPIPVTDNITVAGDPRIQIGDVIEINDWEGMGANIRLQVYGITRELEDGAGLTDTYQVEVIEAPGQGEWDRDRWDGSLIWT